MKIIDESVIQILLVGRKEWLDVEEFSYDPEGNWMGQPCATFEALVTSPKGQRAAYIRGPVTAVAATFSPFL